MGAQNKGHARIGLATGVTAIAFVAAAVSQAKLQLFERDSTLRLAMRSQKYMIARIDYAKRGEILSSDGRPLAEDADTNQLGIEFSRVPHSEGFFSELGGVAGIPASEIMQAADSGVASREWPNPLSVAQSKAIAEIKTRWKADGISLLHGGFRSYPLGEDAAAIVGRMRAQKPETGLELSLNSDLAGDDGKVVGLVDGTGAILPMRLGSETKAKRDGSDVTLTVDANLQILVAQTLRAAVVSHGAASGAAIVMDPRTGDVVAMSSYPTFDPTSTGESDRTESKSDVNFAISSRLEPGSMFKVLTLGKALDDPKFNPAALIDCEAVWTVGNPLWKVRCDDMKPHHLVNAQQAIAESCNISASHWSLGIGYTPFIQYIRDLGLLSKTGVGLPVESSGWVDLKEYAKRLQLANLGFGQSISATPLGLCSAFAMIANGGVQMKPRLVRQIGNRPIPAQELGRRIKATSAATVNAYMESVIESKQGTGYALRIPGYRLAGKTGTAQKVGDPQHGHVANFVGFVPAIEPRFVVLVMIDRPTGAYHGAQVAGPAFRQIAQGLIQQYHIPQTEPLPSPR